MPGTQLLEAYVEESGPFVELLGSVSIEIFSELLMSCNIFFTCSHLLPQHLCHISHQQMMIWSASLPLPSLHRVLT